MDTESVVIQLPQLALIVPLLKIEFLAIDFGAFDHAFNGPGVSSQGCIGTEHKTGNE
jgi:hypothetical protein